MSESFGSCEANMSSTQAAGISALAEQAAAQGITYLVSSGDDGAEGCDNQDVETVADGPISVSGLASTAFNVAVGGTVFNENGKTTYWSSSNTSTFESAVSYIPEDVWNDSCPQSTCGSNANIWAASGGVSTLVSKPSWQSTSVTGVPNDGARDVPDVSLSAASHDPYLVCLEGSCIPNGQGRVLHLLCMGNFRVGSFIRGRDGVGGTTEWGTAGSGELCSLSPRSDGECHAVTMQRLQQFGSTGEHMHF